MNDPAQLEAFPEPHAHPTLRLRWVREGKTINGGYRPGVSDPADELLSLAVERRAGTKWEPVTPEPALTLVNACAPAPILRVTLELLEKELESVPLNSILERLETLAWVDPTDDFVIERIIRLPAREFAAAWQEAAIALPQLAERLTLAAPRGHLSGIGRQELVALLRNSDRAVRRAAATAASRLAKETP